VVVNIGVLALQGDVSEHIRAFERALSVLGEDRGSVIPVRRRDQIPDFDAIAIPGGESTTISRLIDRNRMREPLIDFDGGIFATCAGMVLVGSEVDDPGLQPLGIIDMKVRRNAFGRQRDSFEAELRIEGLVAPFRGIFIRAPVATECGQLARCLCRIPEGAVAVAQGPHMALSFHPELGRDPGVHLLFLGGLGMGESRFSQGTGQLICETSAAHKKRP